MTPRDVPTPEPRLLLSSDRGVVFVDPDGSPGGERGSYQVVSRGSAQDPWTLGERVRVEEGPGLALRAVDWMRRTRTLPPAARAELDRYVEAGIEPGYFLRCVLEDSLTRALGAADPESELLVPVYVAVIYWSLPTEAWGSRDAVRDWVRRGGRRGAEAARIEAASP